MSDLSRLKKAAKEQADLDDIIKAYRGLTGVVREIEELEGIVADAEDPELVEMARDDLQPLKERQAQIEKDLSILLLPKDPNDSRTLFSK